MSSAMYERAAQQQAESGAPNGDGGANGASADEDVVDAEVVDEGR